MIEVFRTNVETYYEADLLVAQICKNFPTYTVNFDLDDCDKILRVHSSGKLIQSSRLIDLMRTFGFQAEILEHDLPVEIIDLILDK